MPLESHVLALFPVYLRSPLAGLFARSRRTRGSESLRKLGQFAARTKGTKLWRGMDFEVVQKLNVVLSDQIMLLILGQRIVAASRYIQ